jgi:hypothetical protein
VAPQLITTDIVASLIRSSSKGAWLDNFPVDILKQLTKTQSKKEFPVDTRLFLDLLTGFFNTIFTFGQCPRGVLNFYDSGELIHLLQGASKIRPIGKATIYRKIVDVVHIVPPNRRSLPNCNIVEQPLEQSGCLTS